MKAKFVRLLLLITITATTLSMTSCGKRSQEMTPASSVSAEKETVSYNFTSEDVKSLLDDLQTYILWLALSRMLLIFSSPWYSLLSGKIHQMYQ